MIRTEKVAGPETLRALFGYNTANVEFPEVIPYKNGEWRWSNAIDGEITLWRFWENEPTAATPQRQPIAATPQRQPIAATPQPINRLERDDVEWFAHRMKNPDSASTNGLDHYQQIATKSAIYPGKGTPFGLMYAALGLAEAGEVQNKVKKAFRDDGVIAFGTPFESADGVSTLRSVNFGELSPERRAQIIKELGGVLWYIAAVCDEIGATMSEVALQNLEELCSRGERGTLGGDGDNR